MPDENPCGIYRRDFYIDKKWGKVYFTFEGVATCAFLYINGNYVGFTQGSHLQATFDITEYVSGGKNEVTVKVFKWCCGSYLEDQDAFRYNGIFRDVYITQRPVGQYNHPYGCPQLGDDMNMTLKYLSGLIKHPNAAAVLVVGLGCENGNIEELKKVLGDYDETRVKFLVAQDFEDEIAEGVEKVEELSKLADTYKREECPVSELVIGLKCGGSDGFSGITVNPLLGSLSDRIIDMGGSAILTEVPEMFGAETILMNRCRTENEFNKTVDLINNFKKYFMRYGEKVDENPSPGNKEGGITTLKDKALGCTQKCGTAPVEDVLSYGECAKKKGLSLLQAPGNDLVAANALAVSGAQLILFTTGRGTPFGCPVPTAKISSNSDLANKKKSWIDFNAGTLLENKAMPDLTDEFLNFVLKLASGEIKAKDYLYLLIY